MQWWPRGGLWRHREFLHLWAAQAVSAVGSRITRTAIPVIAVLAVDGSAVELGLLSAISVGPGAIVGLVAGGRIDRAAKRPILIGADLVRAVLVATIPIAAWLGALTMTQLYVVAGLMGCASTLFQMTDNAYLPALIGTRDLVDGNAKLETTESIAEISGPGLAGVLIELLTAPITMLVDAATYVWSALLLSRIRATESPAPATDDDSLAQDIRTGLRACWHEPLVRPLLVASAVSTLSWGFFFALYMLYTLDDLALSPGVVGAIISVGGVGALLGALLSRRTAAALGTGKAMFACLLLGQAGALLIPLAAGPTAAVIALLVGHQLLGDGFVTAYQIQAVSLRQAALPLHVLARANGVFTVVHSALLPIGALIAGVAGEALGVRTAVWIGVVGGTAAPLALLPLWRLDRIPTPQ